MNTSEVTFQLFRRTTVRAHRREEKIHSVTTWFLGFGRVPCEHVEVNVPEKEWVPMHGKNVSSNSNSKNTGVWVQCAQFASGLVFNVPPTFSLTDRIAWEYFLKLKVTFPGLVPGVDNDVKLEVPVTIVSGIDKAVPHQQPPPGPDSYVPLVNGIRSSVSQVALSGEYWQGHGTRLWDEFNKEVAIGSL
ncbi:hypothetical protein L227DRAFT_309918 [Lentinus tigrinus ALCF2SS1-6]|uniref:Arrestin-like N-terminal domain-containing protein n=2 Tax=Lentinus tigrinus TaxID=5365 RepID=A0A5C2RVW6_9APHY|nr:hypothetical protein L227DRAFT_309918 [Lentinus tigrinus ALCF2SS1-6]